MRKSVKGCLSQAVDHSARTPDGVGGNPTPPATLKILHLTIYQTYFRQIITGEKTIERREPKPYWITRLYHDFPQRPKVFDIIRFRNGYGNHRPFVDKKWVNTSYNYALDQIEICLTNL
jgi:hypothetical protein